MTRPMVTVGMSFLLTTLVVSFLLPLISVYCLIIMAIILIVAVFSFKQSLRIKLSIIIISCIIAMSAYLFKVITEVNSVTSLAEKNATITAVITDKFTNDKGTNGYELTVTNVSIGGVPNKFKTNLYTALPLDIDYYDTIKIDVNFFKINSTTSFDTARYYKQKGIHIFSYAKDIPIEVKDRKSTR